MADSQNSAGKVPGDLPLYLSGWGAKDWDFEPGDAFWSRMSDIGEQGSLSEAMDAAMEGKSAPRVWLILHEPGQPELAAVAALAFARELGGRDQAALVLDCDDQSQNLTTWAGRLESEGWIDLARYGTSVFSSSVPMPFSGRRGSLVGVGSFAPTDVTSEEIQQLVNRLRRQSDDLILVAPADKIGALWAPLAGIRLLCWDRASRPVAEMEGLVASLAENGAGLTGLVGFGLPREPASAVGAEVVAEEVGAADEAREEVPAPVLDDRPDPELPEPEDDEVDPDGFADDFEAPVVAREDDKESDGWTEAPAFDEPLVTRKGTSGVFWFLTTASVVIVAILGVYWFRYVRVPNEGHFQPIEVVANENAPVRVPGDRSQGDMANHDDPPADEELGAAGDSATVAEQLPEQTSDPVADPGGQSQGDQVGADQATTKQPVEQPATTAAADETAPAEPVFDKAPYLTQVGADGWALHLYSFPDSESTDAELAELHRRGFETEVRVVETQNKGRWWRVYVGSFATRIEARDAAALLKKKLRTDWANPTRF